VLLCRNCAGSRHGYRATECNGVSVATFVRAAASRCRSASTFP